LVVLAGTGLIVGCSANPRPVLPSVSLPAATATIESIPEIPAVHVALVDPSTALIERSEALFGRGQAELLLGHLSSARNLFNQSVDLLLGAPGGAKAEPRLYAHYERLLNRINAAEISALREGDGFTQVRMEAAVIDRLLEAATLALPEPALATGVAVAADLASTVHDLPIENNDRVQSFVELFQGNLHDFMQESLERSSKYLPMVQEVFRSEGIPLDLAYLAIVESGYKTNALSRASARGMWQFMPATGKEHGLEQNWFLDERSDPEKATRAAAQYLKTLHRMFDGDWNMAMASYNAGPGRLQRAVAKSKINDYWKLTATSKYLPKETTNYVPMIMAAVLIAKNPEAYGFVSVPHDPLVFDRVTVPDALDLRTVAEWTDSSIENIRTLNPELRRTTTPVGAHDLKIPLGMAPVVEARLATADPSLFAKFSYHKTKSGETLAAVARRYKITRTDLAAANNLRTTARLQVGQSLLIPIIGAAALTSTVASADTSPLTYRVKSGDTLYGIARQFDTTIDDLKRWNSLTSSKLAIGDRLTIHRN
jgi:membrane-bound lytic murein transglycosylase D